MKDEFVNRLTMFRRAADKLAEPASKTIWENQKPLVFTTKAAQAATHVRDLAEFCRPQGITTTGAALDKAREEEECETAAWHLGQAEMQFFRDQGDETTAATVGFPESAWRRWSGETLLAKARLVETTGRAVATGAQATLAGTYGIDADAVAALKKETDDFEGAVDSPDRVIGDRATLTRQLRRRFAAVEEEFEALDTLVVQFGKTPAGKTFVEQYFQARQIIDRGHGPGTPPPKPPTPLP